MTPNPKTPLDALPLLAVDVETTGLSVERERVLAVGWVPVDGTRIDLSGARRLVIRALDPGDAVTIHGLTHDDLASGVPLVEVLAELRRALDGRALLAHHAPFDVRFLAAAYRSAGETPPVTPVVDTLSLQRRILARTGQQELPRGALRLWEARRRFGLPVARAHDALGDALACAELYLAQVAELDAGLELTLRDVRLRTGRWTRARRWLRRRRWRMRRRLYRRRGDRPGAPAG